MKNLFHNLKARLIPTDSESPFLEHLEAFRQMIFRCLITVVLVTLVCIPFAKPILGWLKAPLMKTAAVRSTDFELITTSPIEGFVQVVKVVFATGILLSLPLLIFFIARFILPGIKPKERKVLLLGGFFGTLLFAGGVSLC